MAALIDAGADATKVFAGLGTLGLAYRNPRLETVLRGGFRALHLAGTPATGQAPYYRRSAPCRHSHWRPLRQRASESLQVGGIAARSSE